MKIRPSVLLPLRASKNFLDVYFNQGNMGGVLIPATAKLSVGDEVELEIAFAEEKMVFHTRGIARWRRTVAQKNLPAGVGIEFLQSEKRTRDLLLEFANGKTVHLIQRQSRRFPVVIVVEYETDSVFLTDVTDDLSREGAFICSETLPLVGETIRLNLKPPGSKSGISVNAEIVWHRTEHRRGFGVRFVIDKRGTRKKLDDLIAGIKEQMVRVVR